MKSFNVPVFPHISDDESRQNTNRSRREPQFQDSLSMLQPQETKATGAAVDGDGIIRIFCNCVYNIKTGIVYINLKNLENPISFSPYPDNYLPSTANVPSQNIAKYQSPAISVPNSSAVVPAPSYALPTPVYRASSSPSNLPP